MDHLHHCDPGHKRVRHQEPSAHHVPMPDRTAVQILRLGLSVPHVDPHDDQRDHEPDTAVLDLIY